MISCPFCHSYVQLPAEYCSCGYPFDIGDVILFDWSDYDQL